MIASPRRAAATDTRHITLEDVAHVLLIIGAFCSSWNGVHLGSLQLVDLTIGLALGVLLLSAFGQHRLWTVALPPWLWAGVAAITASIVANILFPPSRAYLVSRLDLIGLHGEAKPSAAMAGIQWLVALLILPACVAASSWLRSRSVGPIAHAWCWGIAVSALIGLTDRTGLTSVSASLIADGVDYSGRQAGLTAHANSLGVSCALALPIAVWLYRRRPFTGLLLESCLLIGAVLSGSRGAQLVVIALLIGLAVMMPRLRRPIGTIGAATVLLSPLLIGALGGFSVVTSTLLRFGGGATSASNSDEERRQIALQGLHDFATHPISGVGLNEITYAHNIYLQMLSAGGLLLITGMAVFFFGLLLQPNRGDTKDFSRVVKVTLSAWLVLGLVENSIVDRYLYFPVGFMAVFWAQSKLSTRRRGNPRPRVERTDTPSFTD